MTAIHVYRAKGQPATRFHIEIDDGRRIWTRIKPRATVPCSCCRRRRWAANATASVHYDGTWFYCRPGKGCKAVP